MFNDSLNITGRLTVKKYTLDGKLVQEVKNHNDITMAGRKLVAALFNNKLAGSDNIERVSQIKVGSSKNKFNAMDEDLISEVDTIDIQDIETDNDYSTPEGKRVKLTITGELDEDQGNGELREAGLFTKNGVMYNRVTFDTITKSDKFKLTLIWEIIF